MQVSDWFEQVGDVYLNKKELGSSLAMANALRDEQVHFERQARVRMVARLSAAREVPGSNRKADKNFLCFSHNSLRYAALGAGCTLTAVSRSTQPSTLRGTVNEYQPLWLSDNTNGDG